MKRILTALVAAGADVNARNENGATALFFAAGSGTPETVNALVAAGLDVNARDENGRTALFRTASYGLYSGRSTQRGCRWLCA